MCYWQPQSSSWSVASFSSGSESDPPVAFIQLGLLCPGISLPLSFSHTPTEARKWGAGVNLGQIPRGNATPKFPTLVKPNLLEIPTCDSVLSLLTPSMDKSVRAPFRPSLPWKVKSCCGHSLFHKCFMWQPHEATRPSICSWTRGQWPLFRTQTFFFFQEESGPSLGKWNSHLGKIPILPNPNTIKETKCTRMFFSSSFPGGNKSFSLCVSLRLAREGLNNQSLYIILHPAGLLDAAIMAC